MGAALLVNSTVTAILRVCAYVHSSIWEGVEVGGVVV